MTTIIKHGLCPSLPIYYAEKEFRAGLEAIRQAAFATCPLTGGRDEGALIEALGNAFNVWSCDLLEDLQAEPGIIQPGVPIPDRWSNNGKASVFVS